MRADRGFTLIEVLVALAVVGLALAAVAGVLGTSLMAHETVAGAEQALALAEERLAFATTPGALLPGTSKGNFAGNYAWQITVAPYNDGRDETRPIGKKEADLNDRLRLYQVSVSVTWRDGHRGRQLALTTVRLGAAPP
jgi:general secretion pathway protein I